MAALARADLNAIRESARCSLAGWFSLAYPKYVAYPHTLPLTAALEDALAGISPRLIVAEPPRHGKSLPVSELFPSYALGRFPSCKIIQASYGERLINKFGRSTRDLVSSDLFRWVFGFGITPDTSSFQYFTTQLGGEYVSTSIGGGGGSTGFGANIIIIDDPFKNRKQVESPVYRQQVISWLVSVAYQRLEDFEDGRPGIIIINATRWHPNDLTGYVRREMAGENWRYIAMPAVSDPQGRPCNPTDPDAIPLFPAKFNLERYQKIKEAIGSYEWESQYQQNPSPPKGGIIQVEWFQRYNVLPAFGDVVQSWDTAQKDRLTSAYSTCGTFHASATKSYLANMFREKLQYPELKRAVKNLAERDRPSAILIENKASGIQLIQELRSETSLPIIGIEPDADKVVRAFTEAAGVEAGLVFLPELAPWLSDFESEIRSFPGGEYADQVDTLTQFLRWNRTRSAVFSVARTGSRESFNTPETAADFVGFARTG